MIKEKIRILKEEILVHRNNLTKLQDLLNKEQILVLKKEGALEMLEILEKEKEKEN